MCSHTMKTMKASRGRKTHQHNNQLNMQSVILQEMQQVCVA